MVGFDDDWVDALGDRQATYTNLDAGDYRFEVMGSNNDGVWNPEARALNIRINPPVWQTWWAYSFTSLLSVWHFSAATKQHSSSTIRSRETV